MLPQTWQTFAESRIRRAEFGLQEYPFDFKQRKMRIALDRELRAFLIPETTPEVNVRVRWADNL
jgi:hypothetical protein